MQPTITYSIKRLDWNPENPLVISDIICEIIVQMGGKSFTNGFMTSLEFLDSTDPTFINIREMLDLGQKEETFPYLIEFAKQSLNQKATLPLSEEETNLVNERVDKICQNLANQGVDDAEIQSERTTLNDQMIKSIRLTTQHLEDVAIEQLQFIIDDNSEELTTTF